MGITSAPRVASTTTVSAVEMASDSAIDLTLTVRARASRRGVDDETDARRRRW